MRAFLDFEASSLGEDSYPIEVGWTFEDGRTETHLIRPAPDWTDWDPQAEALHGVTRERLQLEGEPHDRVARRVLEALGGHAAYCSAPSWDGKWLSVLLRGAGLPRHAMRLKDARALCLETALAAFGPGDEAAQVRAAALVACARRKVMSAPAAHRALADAVMELAVWLEVRRLAAEAAGRGRGVGATASEDGRAEMTHDRQ